MAQERLTDRKPLIPANASENLEFYVVDKEDVSEHPDGSSFRVSKEDLITILGIYPGGIDLSGYQSRNEKGAANGYVPLNATSKINAAYLPSYVDDVIEGYFTAPTFYSDVEEETIIVPEQGKIYSDLKQDESYRWGGTSYVKMNDFDLAEAINGSLNKPIPEDADRIGIWNSFTGLLANYSVQQLVDYIKTKISVTWESLTGNQKAVNLMGFEDGESFRWSQDEAILGFVDGDYFNGLYQDEENKNRLHGNVYNSNTFKGSYESLDFGKTWLPFNPNSIFKITKGQNDVKIAIDYSVSPYKLVRSTDGGTNWNQVSTTRLYQNVVTDSNGNWVISYNYGAFDLSKGFLTSQDNGLTWTSRQNALFNQLRVYDTDKNGLWIAFLSGTYLRSTDLFANFQEIDIDPISQTTIGYSLVVSGDVWMITSIPYDEHIYVSRDKGLTFEQSDTPHYCDYIATDYNGTWMAVGNGDSSPDGYTSVNVSRNNGLSWAVLYANVRVEYAFFNGIGKAVGLNISQERLVNSIDGIKFENIVNEYKVNGTLVSPENKVLDIIIPPGQTYTEGDNISIVDNVISAIIPEEILDESSTNVSNTNVIDDHIGGRNTINSAIDTNLTIQTDALEEIPLNTPILYQQIGEGNIIVNYLSGVTGPIVQTYKKWDSLVIMRIAANTWIPINPPRPDVLFGGLTSTIVGEPLGARAITNIVKISQDNYDAGVLSGEVKDETIYIKEPDPDMSKYGTIITGFDFRKLTGVQDASVSTITDEYGTNNGTSSNSALTTVNIVGGVKELKFSGGNISLGVPSNLSFNPLTTSFTFVAHLGSSFSTPNTRNTILSKANIGPEKQYLFEIHATGQFRPTISSNLINTSQIPSENDILIMVYDHTLGSFGGVQTYIEGTLVATTLLTANSGEIAIADAVRIGSGADGVTPFTGSFKGLYIYLDKLEQTAITGIQNFLKP